MSEVEPVTDSPQSRQGQLDPRRWKALAVLGLIQFILVLDLTVVNVALPRIKEDLDFSTSGLIWVVNAYALMGGGLLLLGGRLADVYGRKRLFMIGVTLFGIASAVCGAAFVPGMMVAGRFIQGVGEAMAAPASLGLVVLLFPDRRERIKALGIWGGLTGLGGVSGTVVSGVLTDLADWRWIFYINLPIALFALIAVSRLVTESRMVREPGRLNYTGALAATVGLVAIVFGLLAAGGLSWTSPVVLLPLFGGLSLLAAMIFIESRSKAPVIPLHFFTNRTRVTANAVTLLNAASFLTFLYLLTLFMQQVLGYSPLRAGFSYLPLGIGIGAGIGFATALMPRLGVKPLMVVGFFGSAVGMLLISGVHVDTAYLTGVMPAMVVLGVFYGSLLPSTTNAALHETTGQDASLASGVQTTMLHIGGALGLAVLATLAIRHAASQVRDGALPAVAETSGYSLSFQLGALLFAVGGVLVLLLLERRVVAQPRDSAAELDVTDLDSSPR